MPSLTLRREHRIRLIGTQVLTKRILTKEGGAREQRGTRNIVICKVPYYFQDSQIMKHLMGRTCSSDCRFVYIVAYRSVAKR
jgi:hypothetical protein